ncbi:hypothetical protein BOSE62_130823 [Bosea sp. 62]|nr:hypothetical protein BOSE7B_120853 [Bosea sp. 7B]CAD5273455.1 hypothetical protein BOSE21B_30060 [Bosea sp. 21B]CAD5284634.1 hypothetical protein BOSE46_50188 [Bosea sp. 46]VVT60202.1 hypothetical protein BOS5A_210993 [Bosea sp. EC-HK365B]VXB59006.1 hypothetical protein BOSE62_130823 [Bosea sp. 62]VXC11445.1 hypothetical protein BOSE29B_30058 [Bosea sp. 29B]VXC21272.1 hypothetical protein BOSE127_170491 [Bosea sp. 127]VXC63957.1 hypothetical protein BOSE125_30439 [Bosea sp. 125]
MEVKALTMRNIVEFQCTKKFILYEKSSDIFGLSYFKIQRATAHGGLPAYFLLSSRKYVKLREIVEVIEKSRALVNRK